MPQRVTVFMLSALMLFGLMLLSPSWALAQDRTLSLYNTHTHERLTVTYKRNGRFVQSGLDQLNRFLRDWRRDEVTRIDPDLFDIVWSVYREVGASQPIHVVSAYRSPATNDMLRRRSSGVARNSQHTQGRAMDFFIPGVSAAAIRAAGLRLQGGGVGYYPRANTPFVHLDTGSIRMWPRMTRSQLARVFPDGRTVHIPADGRPMPGFEQAQRELQRGGSRRSVTIATSTSASSAQNDGDGDIVLPTERGGGFFAALFGGGRQSQPEPPASVPAAAATPAASATEIASLPADSGPRERYAAPAPVLPPNLATASDTQAPGIDALALARASVPAPTPAPTIDDIQIASLSAAPVPTPATSPVPAADALPPISREQQIDQSVAAPGQIAAIIEARFAEQRAREASLRGQVDTVIASSATATEPTPPPANLPAEALQATQLASAVPATAAPTSPAVALAPAPPPQTLQAQALALQAQPATSTPQASVAPTVTASLTPSDASEVQQTVELASLEPRFVPPVPTPVARATTPQTIPTSTAADASPSASSIVAAAFAAQPESTAPGQPALSVIARAAQQEPASSPVAITGQFYPIADDLSAALDKQSIRGSQHAVLVPPTGTMTLSPTVVQSGGFRPARVFEPHADRFDTVAFSHNQTGS